MQDLLTIGTGALVAVCCSLLGCFLILRKMVMVGDAISHSVLPGIVLAYLVTTTRNIIPMMIGAAVLGVLTTVIIQFFIKKARVQRDASIGVTFTWLFAVGVLMISIYTGGDVDIDQDCILFGEIGYVYLEKVYIDGDLLIGTRSILTLFPLFLIVLGFVIWGYKGFAITSFNPEYASALGMSAGKWNYMLMGLVSITTVFSFESVGAILVVGLLTIPPATAYLLTDRLKTMLWLSSVIGIVSVIIGYYGALWLNSSISGGMVVASGLILFVTLIVVKIKKRMPSKVEAI
jgi:manganese/zinc/iron transport system permease protein